MSSQDAGARPEPRQVPVALLDATRSLLRVRTAGEARRLAEQLVRDLGGDLVPAGRDDPAVLPVDVSFGDGQPRLAAAPPGSAARDVLDRNLPSFLLDARQVLQLSEQNERLAESASTDLLTGLPNRRMVERALGRLSAGDTVILLDLDHFKQVNDSFGHAAGDEVLRVFGRVLRAAVRGRDVVGRYGGEEFLIVLAQPEGAATVLRRLRAEWVSERPYPVTFSAGIAASAGDADETVRLADQALYEAKETGRDRWIWATASGLDLHPHPRDNVQAYLDDAVAGNRRAAVRLTLDLLDQRVPREQIVADLLAPAQRDVGERWYRGEITPADEHLASGVTAAALDTLMAETSPSVHATNTVITCAEGDFHGLAAQMFGESLREHGIGVTVLGSSTPAEAVADFLTRSGADSLAISCSMPVFFPGTVRLIDAAHSRGIPAIVGGRAFGSGPGRAERLGADAWALSSADAAPILLAWKSDPPLTRPGPTPVDPVGLRLFAQADALGRAALDDFAARFPQAGGYDAHQIARTRGDLVSVVRFLAATLLAADPAILRDYLGWRRNLIVPAGLPPEALNAALEALRPGIEAIDAAAALLLDRERRELLGRRP